MELRRPERRGHRGQRGWGWPLVVLMVLACSDVRRGDRAWREGDVAGAVEAWASSPELDDLHRQRLARGLVQLQRHEEARAAMEPVPDVSLTADGWMARGLLALHDGRPEDALVAFSSGAAGGGDPALAVNRCATLLALGRPDAGACADALLAAPGDPAALLGVAASSLAAGDPVTARRALGDLQSAPGASPDQLLEAARLYRAVGDAKEACAIRGRVIAPGEPQADLETGRTCAGAGDWDRAHAALEPLVPAVPEAAFVLGTMALERSLRVQAGSERERWSADARRRFEACRAAYASDPSWHNNVGRLDAMDGEYGRAEMAFRTALRLQPENEHATLNLARLLHARGDLSGAREALDRLWRSESQYRILAGLELARWTREAGEEAVARALAVEVHEKCGAARVRPCVAESALFLAVVDAAGGDVQASLDWLEAAVEAGGEGVRAAARAEPELGVLQGELRFRQLTDPDLHGASESP